jgi:hypothetical protein
VSHVFEQISSSYCCNDCQNLLPLGKIKMTQNSLVRVDFSLRREVFFVVIGAIIGAITMVVPVTFLYTNLGLPYYLTWMAFGHVIGVYSSIIAGVTIHMITAISIGVAVGVFLYKTSILNISKLSNGLLYGLLAGSIVFIVFFIPVYQFVLAPEIARTMDEMKVTTSESEEYSSTTQSGNPTVVTIVWLLIHLVFGTVLGGVSSSISIRFVLAAVFLILFFVN